MSTVCVHEQMDMSVCFVYLCAQVRVCVGVCLCRCVMYDMFSQTQSPKWLLIHSTLLYIMTTGDSTRKEREKQRYQMRRRKTKEREKTKEGDRNIDEQKWKELQRQ